MLNRFYQLFFCLFAVVSFSVSAGAQSPKAVECSNISKEGVLVLKDIKFEQAEVLARDFFACVTETPAFKEKVADIAIWEDQCKVVSPAQSVVLENFAGGRPSFAGEIGGSANYLFGVKIDCEAVGTGLYTGTAGSVWAKIEVIWDARVCLDEEDKTCKESDTLTLTLKKLTNNSDL